LRCFVGERLQVRSGRQWVDFSSRLTDRTTAATDGISRRALTALASFFTHHLSQVKPADFVMGSAGGDVVLGAVRGQAQLAPCGFFIYRSVMHYFWVLLWLGAAAAPSQAVACSALSQPTQATLWRATELLPLASTPAPAGQQPPSGLKVSALQATPPASAAAENPGQASWGAALGLTALAMLVMAWRRGGR